MATGEFGRTPQVNGSGGRDHWTHCWSGLIAGGGLPAGQVIGASDRFGERPADRPVSVSELVATMYGSLRIDPRSSIVAGDAGRTLLDADPVSELVVAT